MEFFIKGGKIINRHREDKKESFFKELIDKPVAIVGRVYHQGEIALELIHGYANLEHEAPANLSTIFPISSMTKQFTAMIVMMFKEKGLLQYKDRVIRYIQNFPSYGKELTIYHLLHQTSGLIDPYSYYAKNHQESYNINNCAIDNLLLKQEGLAFPPGYKFEYSNTNYILLSKIAEVVGRKPFGELLQEMIFSPLNMETALLYDKRYVVKNRAFGYKIEGDELFATDIPWLSYGDGGIFASLLDLESWFFSLFTQQLVKHNTLAEAFTPGRTSDGQETKYGFGWYICKAKNGRKRVFHLGGDPGYGSVISLYPETGSGLIVLSNMHESWRLFNKYAENNGDWL